MACLAGALPIAVHGTPMCSTLVPYLLHTQLNYISETAFVQEKEFLNLGGQVTMRLNAIPCIISNYGYN